MRPPTATGIIVGISIAASVLGQYRPIWAQQPSTRPAPSPQAAPSLSDDQALALDYRDQTADLGGERSFKDGVLTIILPRTDLWVQGDMGEIPTGAGIASTFYFFRCSCGRDKIVGQFTLADYEVNDVLDALRAGQLDVASVSPMFMGDKPRIMIVRFQGEGQAATFAKTLKSALNCIGDARSARQPIEQDKTNPTATAH
jgi:hypothetical protein